MILLHALKILSAKYRWKIFIAHFNHRLRGRASDADERLVRRTAAALRLPIFAGSADVNAFAKNSKLSVEMAARKLRHEFFARTARGQKIKTIALAHHADDQVELFLLRLLRGSGGEGLGGMKWRSPSPSAPSLSLVRPLLDLTKAELHQFAHARKIRFREDATNDSSDFLRNRIRNELLPLLQKKYQPALSRTVLRLMEIVGAEAEFVGTVASSLQPDSSRPQKKQWSFERFPIAIQRRVLQSQLSGLGAAADFELIESLRQSPDKFISVSAEISVARDSSGQIRFRTDFHPGFNVNERTLHLPDRAGETGFDGVRLDWKFLKSTASHSLPRRCSQEFFDADKIGKKIILRHWRAGDRFQPIGMKSAVKLQDFFTNSKILRERRHELIVAATDAGEIFWVESLRISEKFKITSQTRRQLQWRWRRNRR